jgi:hypothetical protein
MEKRCCPNSSKAKPIKKIGKPNQRMQRFWKGLQIILIVNKTVCAVEMLLEAPLYEKWSKSFLKNGFLGSSKNKIEGWDSARTVSLDGYLDVRFSRMDIWKSGFSEWIPGAGKRIP